MKTAHFIKKDITTSKDLSGGVLSYTTTVSRKFKLEEVCIKASVSITETVTLTRDSINGANYDHVLASRSLIQESSYIFRPQGECNFQDGDELKVQCTNANLTGVLYCTIKLSEM